MYHIEIFINSYSKDRPTAKISVFDLDQAIKSIKFRIIIWANDFNRADLYNGKYVFQRSIYNMEYLKKLITFI